MENKLNKPIVLFCIGLGILGIIFGSFFDLDIAKFLYNDKDVFCKILEVIGMLPTYYGLCFISGALVVDTKKRKYKLFKSIILYAFAAGATLGAIYCASDEFAQVIYDDMRVFNYIISAVLGLTAFALGFILCKNNEDENLWKRIIVMDLVVFFGMVIYILLLKGIMHRPRFRAMMNPNYGLDLSLFHNWWEPFKEYNQYLNGVVPKDAFKSFPSGHSAASALSIMFLVYLPNFFPNLKGKKITKFLTLIGACYMLIVMVSRMRLGAHFLSDIAFGSLGALIILFIGNAIIEKKLTSR